MTKEADKQNTDYGIFLNTLLEVQHLQAQIDKENGVIAPLLQKETLLKEKLALYEAKVEELKKELSSNLINIEEHQTTVVDLKSIIERKLENISIDPSTYRAQISSQVKADLKQNFDLSKFDVTEPLSEEEEQKLIEKVIQHFNTITLAEDLQEEKILENTNMQLKGESYTYNESRQDTHYYTLEEKGYVSVYKNYPSTQRDVYYIYGTGDFIGEGSKDKITALTDAYKDIEKFKIGTDTYYKVKGRSGKRALMNSNYEFITGFSYGQIRISRDNFTRFTIPVVIKNTAFTKYKKKLERIYDQSTHRSERFDIDLEGKIVKNRPSKKDRIPTNYYTGEELTTEGFLDKLFDELYDREIMSVRLYNLMRVTNVSNFAQFLEGNFPVYELMKYRNVGNKTIKELRELLEKYGVLEQWKQE